MGKCRWASAVCSACRTLMAVGWLRWWMDRSNREHFVSLKCNVMCHLNVHSIQKTSTFTDALTALGMEKRICTNKTKQCALGVLLVYWANSNGNDKQKKGQLRWIPYLMLGHILTGHKMAALVVMFLWLAADDLLQRGWEIEWQTAVYI